MSSAALEMEAGGLVPTKAKVDEAAAETVVARSYRHPALGDRPVIRLASDRLGEAEDLAMEFLGFESPEVSLPLAKQQRRSLNFAAWALINDPNNARFALDLVKQMKAAARRAKSKPGHAWDAYTEMSQELGRSARHFLPPFWEEVGKTYKDLGNQNYAGRSLNKSLQAERVHALESDRARRRDVVLEFVLGGCLAGKALSEYAKDLQDQYPAEEAYAIFRDLCVRRTRGGMAPWAAMPKDFLTMAKGASLDADAELEQWLEEVIDTPAMGRAANQFWKGCSKHCKRIVARNPAFAVGLLRHTRPEERYYGESKTGPWLELLEDWGVFEYLWEDEHKGAPKLGEPVAAWFGRLIRDQVPVTDQLLEMLKNLVPRLKQEKHFLQVLKPGRWRSDTVDVDVLEACLTHGVVVDDLPENATITFNGWLAAEPTHALRNQDVEHAWQEKRFRPNLLAAMDEALKCRGGTSDRGYRTSSWPRRAFPLAAADRPAIKKLWYAHTANVIDQLVGTGLPSFDNASARLRATLWPDTLRLFPDLAERIQAIHPTEMLQRTLQAGVIDEYGLPALESLIDDGKIKIQQERYGSSNTELTFPDIVIWDKVYAYIIRGDGSHEQRELHVPKGCETTSVVPVADDVAVSYRDKHWKPYFHWLSNPSEKHDAERAYYFGGRAVRFATPLADGSVYFGKHACRPGDKEPPADSIYFHDGERFWQYENQHDPTTGDTSWTVYEVDPQTGKSIRKSVPPWFEKSGADEILLYNSELIPAPPGTENSPLGVKDGLLGWRTFKRRDGSFYGESIDGRSWDKPLLDENGNRCTPLGMLEQVGTDAFLPISGDFRCGSCVMWDAAGTTTVAEFEDYKKKYAAGQVLLLPIAYWHLLQPRCQASSKILRAISLDDCERLMAIAREQREARNAGKSKKEDVDPGKLLAAVQKFLPKAPQRMVIGVADIISRAEHEAVIFSDKREQMIAESQKKPAKTAPILNQKIDESALSWGLQRIDSRPKDSVPSLSTHLKAAAVFLKGEEEPGELPVTDAIWFSMLDQLPIRCWAAHWHAAAANMTQKGNSEPPWLEFLKFWHQLGIAELPGDFTAFNGYPTGAKKNSYGGYDVEVEVGKSYTLRSGDDLFIVIEKGGWQEHPHLFLRYSTAKRPGKLPGFDFKNEQKLKNKYQPGEIKEFIDKAEAREGLPLPTPDELNKYAEQLGASPAEIALIWLCGLNMTSYENNFLPPELRKALKLKVTDAAAARQSLSNLNVQIRDQLFASVVAHGPAAPLVEDRRPVLDAIAKTWKAKMPKRLPLDAALQKRLSKLSETSRWSRENHEELLKAAVEPKSHPLFQPTEIEIRWVKDKHWSHFSFEPKQKKGRSLDTDTLKSAVHLVSMLHAETDATEPARETMPDVIKQITKLVDSPKPLVPLREIYLYDQEKNPRPSEWASQHLGKTKPHTSDGSVRYEDELITAAARDAHHRVVIGFRPGKLKDMSDLGRLLGLLGMSGGEEYGVDRSSLNVICVIKSPGFQKLTRVIAPGKKSPSSWPQDPKHCSSEVPQQIQDKYKLGEDAATLYCQVLALPDPTTNNLKRWNGWTSATLKKATAELVDAKLVMEAKRARAGRGIFLPGEWLELKTPWLPIESWKLPHLMELELNPGDPLPVGGPMVLRPFEDLYAAAWQRVLDGDEPRYEQVARRRKKKPK